MAPNESNSEVRITDEMKAAADAGEARIERDRGDRVLVHGASSNGSKGALDILKAAKAAGYETAACFAEKPADARMTWKVVPGTESDDSGACPNVKVSREVENQTERRKDNQGPVF